MRSTVLALFVLPLGASLGCAHKPKAVAESTAIAPHDKGALTASTVRTADTPVTASDIRRGDSAPLPGSVFFNFDDATLLGPAIADLDKIAAHLRSDPRATLRIEGNCDERGTTEYNLALGSHRAEAARRYLARLGIDRSRISTVSYGAERPKNPGHDEAAWAENRRDDLVLRLP